MLAIAQMIIHLTVERGLDDPLGQLAKQAALTSQPQAPHSGTISQLLNKLLIGHIRQGRPHRHIQLDRLITDHISHKCLQNIKSHTL